MTIPVGAAVYLGREDPDSLIERADTALYAAKNAGRNCVMAASDRGALRVVGGNDAA